MALVALLSWLAQRHLSQQQPSFLGGLAQAAVPVLAAISTLAVLGCRPWLLAPPTKLPKTEAAPAPAPGEAEAQLEVPDGEAEGKMQEGAEVDVTADAASGSLEERRVQLSALNKVCRGSRDSIVFSRRQNIFQERFLHAFFIRVMCSRFDTFLRHLLSF